MTVRGRARHFYGPIIESPLEQYKLIEKCYDFNKVYNFFLIQLP